MGAPLSAAPRATKKATEVDLVVNAFPTIGHWVAPSEIDKPVAPQRGRLQPGSLHAQAERRRRQVEGTLPAVEANVENERLSVFHDKRQSFPQTLKGHLRPPKGHLSRRRLFVAFPIAFGYSL